MTIPQKPLGSGFTAHSITLDVIRGIDLTGRVLQPEDWLSELARRSLKRNVGGERPREPITEGRWAAPQAPLPIPARCQFGHGRRPPKQGR